MHNSPARPRLIGAAVSVLLAIAVLALPGLALAAPEEGPGTLTASPDPVVLPTTTVNNQSTFQPVNLAYEGEGVASINKILVEGEEAGEFSLNTVPCGDLSNGQSCQVQLATKPNGNAGEKRATLTVTFNGSRPEAHYEISYQAVPAQLAFSPASHDFGLVRINRENANTSFQVENAGEAEVQVGSFDITGPGANVFGYNSNGCSGTWLAPGQSCSVEVWFGPNERAEFEAELRAFANGSTFSAALSGQGGRAIVAPDESPVGFGSAIVGTRGTVRTITLTNSGDLGEGFFIGVIAGGDSGSFELLDEHCTMAELEPAQSCTAHVRFHPLTSGPLTAHLAFFGDGEGGVLIPLEGEGILGAGAIVPGSFDFGALTIGSKTVAHDFTVSNPSSGPITISRVRLSGLDLDQFAIAGDECTGEVLSPGGKCLVRVRFTPDETGAKQAQLRIDADVPSMVATLTGIGTAAQTPVPAATPAGASNGPATASSAPAAGPPPSKPRKRHRRFVRAGNVGAAPTQRAHRADPQG